MLELRPNCEYCDKDLLPDNPEARICSYECTFCNECVQELLDGVCPNCGGGFVPRPIRPEVAYRTGVGRKHHPASSKRVHSQYSEAEIRGFSIHVKSLTHST